MVATARFGGGASDAIRDSASPRLVGDPACTAQFRNPIGSVFTAQPVHNTLLACHFFQYFTSYASKTAR
eukprot:6606135-Prymnesium_polylepis.1